MVHPVTHLTEKSWVPVQNQWVPVKKKNESEIESARAFMSPDSSLKDTLQNSVLQYTEIEI